MALITPAYMLSCLRVALTVTILHPALCRHLIISATSPIIYNLYAVLQQLIFGTYKVDVTPFGQPNDYKGLQNAYNTPAGRKALAPLKLVRSMDATQQLPVYFSARGCHLTIICLSTPCPCT